MHIKTILNKCHKFKRFVYGRAFIVLFCADKKYKNIIIIYTGVLVRALSVLSAAVLQGGAWALIQGLRHNLGLWKEYCLDSVMGFHFNTSLYGAITILRKNLPFCL